MENTINIYNYLCDEVKSCGKNKHKYLEEVDESELFQTMDEIIDAKYPGECEYDVEDDKEEVIHQTKKIKVVHLNCDNCVETDNQIESIKHPIMEFSKSMENNNVDISIRLKIRSIFEKMKQNC